MKKTNQNVMTIEEAQKLSHESQVALVTAILNRISNSQYDDTEIKKTLSDLGKTLNEVKESAKILESIEKGQIEEMLVTLLNNASLQDILAGITVTVDGSKYSVKSVLEAIANMPEIAKEEMVENAEGVTTGRKLTLTDGSIANLEATITVSEDGTTKSFVFAGTIKGFAVSMGMTFKKQITNVDSIPVVGWKPISVTHLVFDLSSQLVAPAPTKTNEEIADINNDGTVGNA